MTCSSRLYKGDSYEICLPLDTGITTVRFYTRGDVVIEKEADENMCFLLTKEELDLLPDGVLRYSYEGTDTNTDYYLKTPDDYSGSTIEEVIAEAYESGYTDGQEDCTGGTCEGVYESGYTDGYASGSTDGYQEGYEAGQATCEECEPAYNSGYTDGYHSGYTDGQETCEDCTPAYESGYTDGYQSGTTDGYQSGSTRGYDSGYSEGSQVGYQSGYTEGEAAQKAKLTSTSITENNIYTSEDGWNYVTVNIPQTGYTPEQVEQAYQSGATAGYQSGYTEGEDAQKARLVTTSVTQNATYSRTDGFSSITVSVPQTGYTQQDLDNAYASGRTDGYTSGRTDGYAEGQAAGYQSGYTQGYNSGYTDGQETCEDCTNAYNSGYTSGHTDGYQEGYQSGYTDGEATCEECDCTTAYTSGYTDGYASGTTDGYNSGYTDGQAECGEHDYSKDYLTIEANEAGTFVIHGSAFYSVNDGAWAEAANPTSLSLSNGDKVRFKDSVNHAQTGLFSGNTMSFKVYGNIEALEYGDDFSGATSVKLASGFIGMFLSSTGLNNAENLVLPATSLQDACYKSMFRGCTNITTAPELPSETLKGECYAEMFSGCTSLTTAPELPATSYIGNSWYKNMFSNCTSLTTAPELPIGTLYRSAYAGMFSGCTSLNYIKCLATDISANSCVNSWVDGVAVSGTFVKNPNMVSWPTGNSGIPDGWTVVDAS